MSRDLQPTVPDEILADLLRALEMSSNRARAEVLTALAEGIDTRSWRTATEILDDYLEGLAGTLEGGLLAAALGGAWRVGEQLPGGNSEPTGGTPSAIPPQALSDRLREMMERLPPEVRPLFVESLRPEVARTLTAKGDSQLGELVTKTLRPTQLAIVENAVTELRSRRLVRHEDLDEMSADARARAVVASGVVRTQALGALKDLLVEQVESGPNLRDFRAKVEEDIGGDVFLSPSHLETTFRDAVQETYSAGMDRILDIPAVGDLFLWEENLPIRDSRLSSLCAVVSRSGIGGTAIYRRDDPTWQRLKPPRHPNCRCGRLQMTLRQAARAGVWEALEWLATGIPPKVPEWVPMPEIAIKGGL